MLAILTADRRANKYDRSRASVEVTVSSFSGAAPLPAETPCHARVPYRTLLASGRLSVFRSLGLWASGSFGLAAAGGFGETTATIPFFSLVWLLLAGV